MSLIYGDDAAAGARPSGNIAATTSRLQKGLFYKKVDHKTYVSITYLCHFIQAKALSLIYGNNAAVGARPNLVVILPPPPPSTHVMVPCVSPVPSYNSEEDPDDPLAL